MKIYVAWSDYQGIILGYYSSLEKAQKRIFEEVVEQENFSFQNLISHEMIKNYPEILEYEKKHNFDIDYLDMEQEEGVYLFSHPDYDGNFPVYIYEEEFDSNKVLRGF